jgi:hypothetical protein
MPTTTSTKRRLGAISAACLLSVALPIVPTWAETAKTAPTPAAETAILAPSPKLSVQIPTIDAVGSNVSEPTLRAIFSGNIADNASALAGLTADSITIPQITLDAQSTIDGQTADSMVVFTDIELKNVVDGVAGSVTLSGMTMTSSQDVSGEFGSMSANNFDIGGILRLYGLVDAAGQTEFKTIYTDYSFSGGTFDTPEVSCTIGAASVADFKARPIKSSFAEIMALSQTLEQQGDDPSPATVGKALRMYVDLLTAFESSPVEFDGFDCNGTDSDSNPFDVSVASMTMGAMSPGTYPSFDISGLAFTGDSDGSVTIGKLNFKKIDLSAPIAAIQAAPENIDSDWLTANARALIPAFAGFLISDVAVDIPDPETEGDRIVASVGSFDLSLANYINGIPSALTTSAKNIMLELPSSSTDEQLQLLMSLGVTSIDAGFTIDTNWDEANNAIAINEVSVTAADLASIRLAGTINNATDMLFNADENMVMAAAMGLAVGKLKLDINDDGLSDIIMNIVAADQGADAATMRPIFAGLAEGTIIGVLAGASEAQKVASAVNAFVAGKARNLSIEVTSKDLPGVGLMDFLAAEEDPMAIIDKVNIDASN